MKTRRRTHHPLQLTGLFLLVFLLTFGTAALAFADINPDKVLDSDGNMMPVDVNPDNGREQNNELNGNGLNGNGNELNGNGLEEAALEGSSLDGAGLNEAGLDEAGLDGAGLDGAGLNEAGLNEAGLDEMMKMDQGSNDCQLADPDLERKEGYDKADNWKDDDCYYIYTQPEGCLVHKVVIKAGTNLFTFLLNEEPPTSSYLVFFDGPVVEVRENFSVPKGSDEKDISNVEFHYTCDPPDETYRITGRKFEALEYSKPRGQEPFTHGETSKFKYVKDWTLYLFEDTFDNGEPVWTDFDLGDDSDSLATAITNSRGYYEFTGVADGHYYIVEEMKEGWIPVYPESGFRKVEVDGQNVHYQRFYNADTADLSIQKCWVAWDDALNFRNSGEWINGADRPDCNSPEGMTFEFLLKKRAKGFTYEEVARGWTDQDGVLVFDGLKPGTYRLYEIVPADATYEFCNAYLVEDSDHLMATALAENGDNGTDPEPTAVRVLSRIKLEYGDSKQARVYNCEIPPDLIVTKYLYEAAEDTLVDLPGKPFEIHLTPVECPANGENGNENNNNENNNNENNEEPVVFMIGVGENKLYGIPEGCYQITEKVPEDADYEWEEPEEPIIVQIGCPDFEPIVFGEFQMIRPIFPICWPAEANLINRLLEEDDNGDDDNGDDDNGDDDNGDDNGTTRRRTTGTGTPATRTVDPAVPVTEEPTPLAPPVEPAPPEEPVVLEEEEPVPLDVPELPQTGQLPPGLFYLSGALLASLGLFLRQRW